ncbi:DUF5992 family protein [Spartinivicinus poritis]|uniref:DUF5992 family protein n=1 Tax=Spartinivicinus poritis TaxID=2994640 RepID=A0ABT5UGS4_9GAMM|nr:DUF5992 family protein [Spartinivicinus sp. A2-2]MDE1465575.1 DUF5992 family protein [Spartinivicinus sp. A2-2]
MKLFAKLGIVLGAVSLSFSANTFAAVMVKGKITQVSNMTSQPGTFGIFVEGSGNYPCNNNNVAFNEKNFPDKGSFERTYSMALAAFAAGYTVEIHNDPQSASCPYLNYMVITK